MVAHGEVVEAIRTLGGGKDGDGEAMDMLLKVVSMVKPIMKKYGWKVGQLREFYPNDPKLWGLNVNHGQEVKLRLRTAQDKNRFLDFESVVGTMLHELAHNVHGPHDAKFYALLSKLEEEYYALVARGYTGEGFDARGDRVGIGLSHNLPLHLARKRAADAAEERMRKRGWSASTPSGGVVLGLTPETKSEGWQALQRVMTPVQMAAMAAEKRLRDDVWCGSGRVGSDEEGIQGSNSNASAVGQKPHSSLSIRDVTLSTKNVSSRVPHGEPQSTSTSSSLSASLLSGTQWDTTSKENGTKRPRTLNNGSRPRAIVPESALTKFEAASRSQPKDSAFDECILVGDDEEGWECSIRFVEDVVNTRKFEAASRSQPKDSAFDEYILSNQNEFCNVCVQHDGKEVILTIYEDKPIGYLRKETECDIGEVEFALFVLLNGNRECLECNQHVIDLVEGSLLGSTSKAPTIYVELSGCLPLSLSSLNVRMRILPLQSHTLQAPLIASSRSALIKIRGITVHTAQYHCHERT
ncbi:WLM domain-containing protein [Cladochytrium replicatum]|nr:WLM domain-containing protein [Cladochytrium replicatum]